MIYFDYDGVLGNTDVGLFDDYERQLIYRPNLTQIQYIMEMDWPKWLRDSGPKNNSFDVLKSHDPKLASILTRIWSVQEAIAKTEYIRENKVKNDIIFVPGRIPKSMVVSPEGNLLVEDQFKNCLDWIGAKGIAVLLNQDGQGEIETITDIEQAYIIAYLNGYI